MITTYPGTTVEVRKIEKGSSRQLFDGLFAAGGITLSQVTAMTELEPYMIQNWIKRGFLSSPVKRQYSRSQFARIVMINMLRESLQIEHICDMWRVLERSSGGLISNEVLYHGYVDMLAKEDTAHPDPHAMAEAVAEEMAHEIGLDDVARKKLTRVLVLMWYAHAAARLQQTAASLLAALD